LPARISSSERLWPWVGLPVLALVLIAIAVYPLPAGSCDGYEEDTGLAGIAVLVLTGVAVASCLAAASVRLVALKRAGLSAAELGVLVGALPALALLTYLPPSSGEYVLKAIALGCCATVVALLALVVNGLLGRHVGDVRVLLPLFLLGAALFVYPSLAMLGLAVSSGIGC
jgi:hypothetical protein